MARLLIGLAKKADPTVHIEMREVNGGLALVGLTDNRITLVVEIVSDGERVHTVSIVVNPDKLHAFPS